jgi:tRNA A37 threonylcarbamoyladenosine modification protein TsaB
MIELYFSLSSPCLFLALLCDNKCLASIQKENVRLHSENFLTHLKQILEKCHFTLPQINRIYFTSEPSGHTGLRVSLAFLSTLQVLNTQIEIYHINTLLLQSGGGNCLSLLTIDNQGNKYHTAVCNQEKFLLPPRIIFKENLTKLKEEFSNFPVLKNFYQADFLKNFQKLKKDFKLLRKIEEIPID